MTNIDWIYMKHVEIDKNDSIVLDDSTQKKYSLKSHAQCLHR